MPAEPDPLWYKDAIFYELSVRAFRDGNGDGIGDLPGLIEKLDYLARLGVDCIRLLPFYPSPLRDDGYDVADFGGVHPDLGTLSDVKNVIDAAHARGIRVVADLVLNHTSDQHPWFQEARSRPDSPRRDWYVWSDDDRKWSGVRVIFSDTESSNWTWDPSAKQYFWHRFFSHQPDLNYENPEVRAAMFDVARAWLRMGIDGFRCDAVPYLYEQEETSCEGLPETHAFLRSLRAMIDAEFPGRLLIAEASAKPPELAKYFGADDEFHMAFHFPLVPRVFIALRSEQRAPIEDAFAGMPAIPERCQWALFLRNHDELSLSHAEPEQRAFVQREYAKDPRMRLNKGIRRRLAPLLDGGRRRLELAHALLLSLPGSPFLYYGDEIGMGDNVWLQDRDGLRTPMQWSADRNSGFSEAPAAALFAPVIQDPPFAYASVNVEMQERDPASLLSWLRRVIAIRRSTQVFGRGATTFVRPSNPHVLAYLRTLGTEAILCVMNLSRWAQPVELGLDAIAGRRLVDMFGGAEFPAPEAGRPYFLSLGPRGFYWLRAVAPGAAVEPPPALDGD